MNNESLHEYLCERTKLLTETWYENLDKNKEGIYGIKDTATISRLKEHNQEFHVRFCSMFIEEDKGCLKDFQDWISTLAKDEAYLNTPLTDILEEFFVNEKQYLDLINEYALLQSESVSLK